MLRAVDGTLTGPMWSEVVTKLGMPSANQPINQSTNQPRLPSHCRGALLLLLGMLNDNRPGGKEYPSFRVC
jgi:hypothetical protein